MTEKTTRDTMAEVFDQIEEIEKREAEVEEIEAVEPEQAPEESEAPEDASPEQDDQPEAEAEQDDGPVSVEAPEHWSAAERERFEAIPDPEARRMLLDVRQSLERGYDSKFQSLADERRVLSEWDQVFAPVEQNLQLAGVSRIQAVQRLLAAQQMLERNPQQGLTYLAQQYGVNLNEPASADAEADPQYAGLQSKLQTIEERIAQREQAEQQSKEQAVTAQIESFRSETTDNGALAHPHFDKVASHMAALFKVNPDADLKALYDQAVYANPETRADVIAAERKVAQLAEARKAKEKAQKAKKAQTLESASGDKPPQKGASPRETMAMVYDKVMTGS